MDYIQASLELPDAASSSSTRSETESSAANRKTQRQTAESADRPPARQRASGANPDSAAQDGPVDPSLAGNGKGQGSPLDRGPAPARAVVPDYPVLLDQPVLVTGSSSGIGRAVAVGLARAGANVVLNYAHDKEGAEETAHEIASLGRRVIVVQADVSKEDDVTRLFASAIEAFGTVHVAVSNAGLQQDGAFEDMTLAQWQKVIDINLSGQFLCTRAAVREFRRRGPEPAVSRALGKIICMSSVHQLIPWAGHANYAASKGGLAMLMATLAQEVAPLRIRVNGIAPGAIRTPINREAWDTPQALAELLKLIPYGRIGEPEDVARAATWLASDASDYVTGTTLFVDGGMALYPGFAHGG